MSPGQGGIDSHVVGLLQQRYEALLERDLANVEQGIYPRELLFQLPLLRYLRQLPAAVGDLPRFLWRSFTEQHDDLPAHVDRSRYPRYYLRTFHWQTDGWLSERSARLYEPSVEFLFAGTADIGSVKGLGDSFDRMSQLAASTGRACSTSPAARAASFSSSAARCRRPSSTASTSARRTWRTPRRCSRAATPAW
jgi:hypothetical protein